MLALKTMHRVNLAGVRSFSSSAYNASASIVQGSSKARRAVFYVPGGEERKLNSSLKLKGVVDCFCYDLEDGVAFSKKADARNFVYNALDKFDTGSSEKAVRINAVGSGLETEDLKAVLRSSKLESIMVPKVQSADDIHFVTKMIEKYAPAERRSEIKLMAGIETGLALMNLKEIATSDPRVDCLVFASEDFCADVGLIRTSSRKEMIYARQAVVTTAAAYGLQAVDLVCIQYNDENVLIEECEEGHQFGFTGKQAIHPKQIETIQKLFLPSDKDVDFAERIVAGFKENTGKGVGAFNLDGKMIDMPMVKWAERMLKRARR
ncbi:Pyruvate/Phosphoenolpyruvate kinase-like domain-containing protein [Cladochytrium replicatum]|nr:Pyruvate/Phosphoenolpyruvate kinase-like domain-containing protein [Cladochytrium replicatum]